MKLPVEFLERMKSLLGGDEYGEFVRAFDMQRYYGLRVNTLKISVDEFLKISPFRLEPVPWTRDGFYYQEGENPGKHPYYHAGLYYIQEPSAMLPGEVLGAKPGERVLDLCAAPGGKTVRIAAGMKGRGILIANDISSERVKALVKNVELFGARNVIVTNESPEKLSARFPAYFDRILVDAPCSGEGMFRKDPDAVRSWERYKCETCAGMQRNILESADAMLKPGGFLVYSTCTFSPEENEMMISEFLGNHKEYELVQIPQLAGIEGGRPEWCGGNSEIARTARLWPHRVKGEGHFVALLRKGQPDKTSGCEGSGNEQTCNQENANEPAQITENVHRPVKIPGNANEPVKIPENEDGRNDKRFSLFQAFMEEHIKAEIDGFFLIKGSNLYCLPEVPPDLSGIKVAKFGWYLGEFARDRFEPSHSLVMALSKEDIKNTVDFSSGSEEILRYLKGETLMLEGRKGITAVCVDGYTVGWAKQTGDMLKNLYPKGWRKMV